MNANLLMICWGQKNRVDTPDEIMNNGCQLKISMHATFSSTNYGHSF